MPIQPPSCTSVEFLDNIKSLEMPPTKANQSIVGFFVVVRWKRVETKTMAPFLKLVILNILQNLIMIRCSSSNCLFVSLYYILHFLQELKFSPPIFACKTYEVHSVEREGQAQNHPMLESKQL